MLPGGIGIPAEARPAGSGSPIDRGLEMRCRGKAGYPPRTHLQGIAVPWIADPSGLALRYIKGPKSRDGHAVPPHQARLNSCEKRLQRPGRLPPGEFCPVGDGSDHVPFIQKASPMPALDIKAQARCQRGAPAGFRRGFRRDVLDRLAHHLLRSNQINCGTTARLLYPHSIGTRDPPQTSRGVNLRKSMASNTYSQGAQVEHQKFGLGNRSVQQRRTDRHQVRRPWRKEVRHQHGDGQFEEERPAATGRKEGFTQEEDGRPAAV